MADSRVVTAAYDYVLCGWPIRSVFPLPSLVSRVDGLAPCVDILCGSVTEPQEEALVRTVAVAIYADRALVVIPRLGRFLVESGARITVEPAPGARTDDLHVFLCSICLGLLAQQRGLEAFRGSAVAIDAGVIAFLGQPGTGRSSIAAAIALRGYSVVADDVVVIQPERLIALPVGSGVALWKDAAHALGIDVNDLPPVRRGMQKYLARLGGSCGSSPLPLSAVVLCTDHQQRVTPTLTRVEPREAFAAIQATLYPPEITGPVELARRRLEAVARVAHRTPVYALGRTATLATMPESVELVMKTLGC